MPGTLWVSDARPEGEARRRAWRRGGRWRIWDPPGGPSPHITDLRHQNQGETDVIMTQIREEIPEEARAEPAGAREPGWPAPVRPTGLTGRAPPPGRWSRICRTRSRSPSSRANWPRSPQAAGRRGAGRDDRGARAVRGGEPAVRGLHRGGRG